MTEQGEEGEEVQATLHEAATRQQQQQPPPSPQAVTADLKRIGQFDTLRKALLQALLHQAQGQELLAHLHQTLEAAERAHPTSASAALMPGASGRKSFHLSRLLEGWVACACLSMMQRRERFA